MPLAFHSISHGPIAFGFFNIDSDMLLLEHYFFFATKFCEYIAMLARRKGRGACKMTWLVYDIPEQERIGDLAGAIHGVRYTGFIGELYRRFPFPPRPEDFKQKPEGFRNRSVVEALIREYAGVPKEIVFSVNHSETKVAIGEYHFDRFSFQALIQYVWRGGYPRWKEERRPPYVEAMKEQVLNCSVGVLEGISFEV